MNTEQLIRLRDAVGTDKWYLIASLIQFADSHRSEFAKAHGTKAIEELNKVTEAT